ncbi:hypothetical protein [Acinetobacter nosocomialis]|uniref:hypothetical protein n=1 Tax=Acinetobacter nosocomialis TaxID=106654 RepID=UPI001B8330F6|nr:hypothetical protein [Acinetobacter nosocomialis]MBR7718232.1 hypothetical protein [Acinetobacter nosocomialis]
MELFYLKLLFIDIIGGGSGRLFEIAHGFTVRYLIFIIGIVLIIFKFSFSNITLRRKEFLALLLGTAFIPIGLISMASNDLSIAFDDIKPFLFFSLFFLILSQNEVDSKIILEKFCSYLLVIALAMGLVQLILIILVKINLLPFPVFYAIGESTSNEIMFRGEDGLFFYKGFFFLGVGCIYAFIRKKYLLVAFLFLCIFLTQTRGLLLATIFTILIYLVCTARKQIAFLIFLLSPIILTITYFITMKILFLREDVGDSNVVRFEDLKYIFNESDVFHTLFGYGWGAEIRDRAKLENIFMELFYKTGVIGLVSSLVLIVYVFLHKNNKFNPFLYFMLFAFIFSQTNPFIYTPMGIVLVLMCMLSCRYAFNSKSELIK